MAPLLGALRRLSLSVACALVAASAVAQERRPQAPDAPLVASYRFEGLDSYDAPGVAAVMGLEVGKPMPNFRTAAEEVWRIYRVILKPPEVTPAAGGGVDLVLSVKEMPVDLEPRFIGNDAMSESRLREWALLDDRAEVYQHEKDIIVDRLETGYRRHGFHHVEVEAVTGGDDGRDIIFEIREGPKVRSSAVYIRGNDSLPDTGWGLWRGGLRSLAKVSTKGKGILRWWGKTFDEEVLRADLVAMRQVYRDRGWLDAKVDIEDLEFNDDRDRVRVHVVVDEGELYRIGSLRIEAFEREYPDRGDPIDTPVELLFPEDELFELLELTPGRPFELSRQLHDHRALLTHYGERGYLDNRLFENPRTAEGWQFLEPDVVADYEKKEVHVVYRIVQGRRRFLREVGVVGTNHTRDRVVRREVSAVPGQVADMKELQRSLSRIRGTGYFHDPIDRRHPPPQMVLKEVPGEPDLVDVDFVVEEGRVVNLNLSGGVASDSGLVGLIQLQMQNFDLGSTPSSFWSTFGDAYRKEAFHGNGETFAIDLSPGSEIDYYRLLYRHPDLFGTHFNRYSGTFEFVNRQRRFRSHDEDRARLEMRIAKLFDQGDFSISVGPIFQDIELHDLDDDDDLPSTLVASEGQSDFRGIGFDLRYRNLDNNLDPKVGQYWRWQNTLYGGPLGGDEDIIQTELLFDWYRLLGSDEADVRPGVYFGLAGGVAHPYGDSDFVNYAERYFLGGSSTLRGFRFRGVGPNDGDYSLGGETYVRGTAEYRFPLYTTPIPGTSRRQEVFRGSFFVDAGILDPDSFAIDASELRTSVGIAFGLTQPIPLTFNFGFPVRDGDGDEKETFSFRLSFR